MGERSPVVVSTGTLRESGGTVTPQEGVPDGAWVVTGTGGDHDLHLAVAERVVTHLYREAVARGVVLYGAHVRAEGEVDEEGRRVGVEYAVALDSGLRAELADALIEEADPVPALRTELGTDVVVRRVGHA